MKCSINLIAQIPCTLCHMVTISVVFLEKISENTITTKLRKLSTDCMEPVGYDKSHLTIATACHHGNTTSFALTTRSQTAALVMLGYHGDKNDIGLHKPLSEVDILVRVCDIT